MRRAAALLAVVVLLLCGCGGGNGAANTAGVPLSDEGKAEALVRAFMQASEAQDQAKCRTMLVMAEREPKDGATFKFNADGNLKSWSLGTPRADGTEFVVQVHAEMKDKPGTTTLEMVVVREDSEMRISMEKTFERTFAASRAGREGNSGG